MANVEKLVKAVEALKIYPTNAASVSEDLNTTKSGIKKIEPAIGKKEKIVNCNVVADCVCSQALRNAPEFPKFLGIAMETFLQLCDDDECDIKIVADECLNRTIKTLMESNLGRLQIELYKELKKNGAGRSLRAALWRFADLCHLIRPQKCRPYIVNLLPCLTRICRRPEELVQDTLATSMYKLCPALLGFTTDIETKMLLKSFLPNIKSPSATTRRASAISLTLICQHSRKPLTFSLWLLNVLLDSLIPLEESTDTPTILGVLLSLRHLIGHLVNVKSAREGSGGGVSGQGMKGSFGAKFSDADVKLNVRQMIKVLELLLYYTGHSDHNVVTAALEALHQLLKNAPRTLVDILVTRGGVGKLNIQEKFEPVAEFKSDSHPRLPSLSEDQTSGAATLEEDEEEVDVSTSESDDVIQMYAESEGSRDESSFPEDDQATNDDGNELIEARTSIVVTGGSEEYSGVDIATAQGGGTLSPSSSTDTLSSAAIENSSTLADMDDNDAVRRLTIPEGLRIAASDDRLSLRSSDDRETANSAGDNVSQSTLTLPVLLRTGDIGSLNDSDVPVVHLTRLLCSRFLLTGYPNGLVSDNRVRVSVKALALSCISSIVDIYPKAFLKTLHSSSAEPGDLQDIRDILLYASHSDQQLKGNTCVLVGHLVRAALIEGRGEFGQWMRSQLDKEIITLEELLSPLIGMLDDESAVAARCAVIALQICLPAIMNSEHSELTLRILLTLLHLKNNSYWLVKVELAELLADIDYKIVAYLESMKTPFTDKSAGYQYLNTLNIQGHVLEDVFMSLIADEDVRVRNVAASALCRLVPRLFYFSDNSQLDCVATKAYQFTMSHLDTSSDDWISTWPRKPSSQTASVNSNRAPFEVYQPASHGAAHTESSLSRVVNLIHAALIQSSSKNTTHGYGHALCVLSEQYNVTQFAHAWGCSPVSPLPSTSPSVAGSPPFKRTTCRSLSNGSVTSTGSNIEEMATSSGGGPLPLCVSIVTSSPTSLDLTAHVDVLQLAGNLLAGAALGCMRSPDEVTPPSTGASSVNELHWPALSDRLLVTHADELLTHIARLLNIFCHVLDELSPAAVQNKPLLPSLPNTPSLSPIKRKARLSGTGKEESIATIATDKLSKVISREATVKHTEKDKPRKDGLGQFYNQPHYMRLYDVLKTAYSSYKISLDIGSSEKFIQLLRIALQVLSQLLDVASLIDVGKHAEELLAYLRSTIVPEPTGTVLCVQQLLKAIFGTNLSSQLDTLSRPPPKVTMTGTTSTSVVKSSGIYQLCINTPYVQFAQALASAAAHSSAAGHGLDQDEPSSLIGWLKKKAEKKLSTVIKQPVKTDKGAGSQTSVASYIRLFEPLVIKALKQYTITSHVSLQQQVLDLLAQLVQLRVNYCLLDSDQIFVGYVIKQFEYIEEGQMRHSDELISHMFNFLVLLSYERYHSKVIIALPKVIQLCDGIMASGQDPATHAIPGLQCLVQDLFILRGANKSDLSKELDTQREVVISMLLRLLPHYQVIELFIIVLQQYRREGEDKWKRLSRQVTDQLLPLLEKQQVNIDHSAALDVVHKLFESVTPSVFRPVDLLLKVLLAAPEDLSTVEGIQRWFGLMLVIQRVIMCQSKEEAVLGRLQELRLSVCIDSDTVQRHKEHCASLDVGGTVDCRTADAVEKINFVVLPVPTANTTISPEETLARFLMQVVGLVTVAISDQLINLTAVRRESCEFLCHELSHQLLYITHMFQSGMFRRVATVTMSIIREASSSQHNASQSRPSNYTITDINEAFHKISFLQPTLMLQWCNILMLLNYDNEPWWSRVLGTAPQTPSVDSNTVEMNFSMTRRCPRINSEIVRRGGLIIYSDYVCENSTDARHMSWIIGNHVIDLIGLSQEPPIQDLIGAVHRNSSASSLFLRSLHSACSQRIHLFGPSLLKSILSGLDGVHLSQSSAMLLLIIELVLPTHHLSIARICDSLACRRLEMLLAASSQEESRHVAIEDVNKLLELLQDARLVKRHTHLVSLMNKLHSVVYSSQSTITSDGANSSTSNTSVPVQFDTHIDQDWYLSMVKEQCCGDKVVPRDCAVMLQHLDYSSMLSIIMDKDCNLSLLEECIILGTRRSIDAYNQPTVGPRSPDHTLDALLKASQMTLLRHINNVINMLPVPHELLVYDREDRISSGNQYRDKIEEHFTNYHWVSTVVCLTKALQAYLQSLSVLPWRRIIPEESMKDIIRFGTLFLELIQWSMQWLNRRPSTDTLLATINCYNLILNNDQLAAILEDNEHTTLICSAIAVVHKLLCSFVLLPGQRLVQLSYQENPDDQLPSTGFGDQHHAIQACDNISELVHSLRTHLHPVNANNKLPRFLIQPIGNVIIGLGRLPLVNSYARTPPLVWKLGWMPSPSGDMRTKLPPLPLEYIQEKVILSDFVSRMNSLGWTSRQQFEETWMSLLGVLNPVSLGTADPSVTGDAFIDRTQCQILALRGITSLLIISSLAPKSGNPARSTFEYVPRDKPLLFLQTRAGKKLAAIRLIVESALSCFVRRSAINESLAWSGLDITGYRSTNILVGNLERELGDDRFQAGQLSVKFLWSIVNVLQTQQSIATLTDSSSSTESGSSTSINSPFITSSFDSPLSGPSSPPHGRVIRSAALNGLDIHSCLQFLLELYGSLLSFPAGVAASHVPLMLLNESIRSVVQLSDVFTERDQFDWMLSVLLEVQRSHPLEDELVGHYVVLGICKAAAVVTPDTVTVERVVKLIESSLKSTHLPTKVSALYGSLYLLEAGTPDTTVPLVPVLTEYLLRSLGSLTPSTIHSQQHVLVMWSVAFYLRENFHEQLKDSEFSPKILQLCTSMVSIHQDATPLAIYVTILRGMERLRLSGVLTPQEADMLAKLSVDRLCQPSPQRSLAALGLMLTCMYADLPSASSPAVIGASVEANDKSLDPELMYDADALIIMLERVTVLFDRIRKGFPHEARVITHILPSFLVDFCPSQDIMNKVIGEFLYTQQPHPQLMAKVTFEVFERLIKAEQHSLVCNWVMLSLSNFTQRTPIAMAIWSLTCFFVSASTNCWLRCLMPYVISRMSRLEAVDQKLFCLSALDFRSRLHDDIQLRAFHSTFQMVAQPGTPYAQLLIHCNVASTTSSTTSTATAVTANTS